MRRVFHHAPWRWTDKDWVAMRTPYDAAFVDMIKDRFDPRERVWCASLKIWLVIEAHREEALDVGLTFFQGCPYCVSQRCVTWQHLDAAAAQDTWGRPVGYGQVLVEPAAAPSRRLLPLPGWRPEVRAALALLKIEPTADAEEIREAFERLVALPLLTGGAEADLAVQRALAARNCLLRLRGAPSESPRVAEPEDVDEALAAAFLNERSERGDS